MLLGELYFITKLLRLSRLPKGREDRIPDKPITTGA